MSTTAREEHEWQAMVSRAGQWGVIWAIAKLLIKKRIITADELTDAIATEAGGRIDAD